MTSAPAAGTFLAHAVSGTGAVGGAWVTHPSLPENRVVMVPVDRRRDEPIAYNGSRSGRDDYSVTGHPVTNEGVAGPRVRRRHDRKHMLRGRDT